MANLTPIAGKDDIYQLETGDTALGGEGGTLNVPHQALLNRTEDLYNKHSAQQSEINANASDISTLGGQVSALPDVGLKFYARGEVTSAGVIGNVIKRTGAGAISASRVGVGRYKVAHNLDNAVVRQIIILNTLGDSTIKIAAIEKYSDYFYVKTANDVSTDDVYFEFTILELTI